MSSSEYENVFVARIFDIEAEGGIYGAVGTGVNNILGGVRVS